MVLVDDYRPHAIGDTFTAHSLSRNSPPSPSAPPPRSVCRVIASKRASGANMVSDAAEEEEEELKAATMEE